MSTCQSFIGGTRVMIAITISFTIRCTTARVIAVIVLRPPLMISFFILLSFFLSATLFSFPFLIFLLSFLISSVIGLFAFLFLILLILLLNTGLLNDGIGCKHHRVRRNTMKAWATSQKKNITERSTNHNRGHRSTWSTIATNSIVESFKASRRAIKREKRRQIR